MSNSHHKISNSSTPPPLPQGHSHLRVNKLLIQPLLSQPKKIRNVCILAHVDHGTLISCKVFSFKFICVYLYL